MQIIIGFILGFCVSLYGFQGVAKALDNTVETFKSVQISVDKK